MPIMPVCTWKHLTYGSGEDLPLHFHNQGLEICIANHTPQRYLQYNFYSELHREVEMGWDIHKYLLLLIV